MNRGNRQGDSWRSALPLTLNPRQPSRQPGGGIRQLARRRHQGQSFSRRPHCQSPPQARLGAQNQPLLSQTHRANTQMCAGNQHLRSFVDITGQSFRESNCSQINVSVPRNQQSSRATSPSVLVSRQSSNSLIRVVENLIITI